MDLPRFARDPGLHPGRLGRNAWLELPRFGLGARLDRSRLGCGCRGKRLGFARHKLLLGGQLLNLLGHLWGQGHGGLGGQRRARQALARL